MQGARPNPNTGQHSTHHTRHSIGPQGERQGGRQHTDGGHHTQDGEASNTAALPSPCHPPSAMPPTIHDSPTLHRDEEGEQTEDTPPHEQHRHTLTTHTPHTWQRTVRDMTAVLASTAVGRVGARATPLHWAAQQQHTPPPFHTPRRMDTIHSSTHLLSLIHVHTTNERS